MCNMCNIGFCNATGAPQVLVREAAGSLQSSRRTACKTYHKRAGTAGSMQQPAGSALNMC
jgi:hypothetical protein